MKIAKITSIESRWLLWLWLFACPLCLQAGAESAHRRGVPAVAAGCSVDSVSDTLSMAIGLDKENGIYFSPEPVGITLRSVEGNAGQEFRLVGKLTTDNYLPVDSFVLSFPPGWFAPAGRKITFTPPSAGFYRLTVYAQSGTKRSAVWKTNIGYDPEKIVSLPDSAPGFDAFWKETRAQLDRVAPRFRTTLLADKCSPSKEMYHVEMYSFGDVKIEGYYTVPRKPGKYPAVIRYQGYGAGARFPDPQAMPGFCELILCVRGQGIQKPVNPYGEWIVSGLESKETYYYRGAYMDLIRGVDFLASRAEVDPGNIFAEGGSQGGAFTLAVCALDGRIRAAAPRIPFLSDFRDYFNICPWPRSLFEEYLAKHPGQSWEKIYEVLSYFDIKNLAGRITCPVLMGVGLQDQTCPPHTNFAGYNQIRSEKSYVVYPDQGHSVGEGWWPLREAFFREKAGL